MPTWLDIVIALAFIALSVAEAALTPSVISPLQQCSGGRPPFPTD